MPIVTKETPMSSIAILPVVTLSFGIIQTKESIGAGGPTVCVGAADGTGVRIFAVRESTEVTVFVEEEARLSRLDLWSLVDTESIEGFGSDMSSRGANA
jgi:hypothetical protein